MDKISKVDKKASRGHIQYGKAMVLRRLDSFEYEDNPEVQKILNSDMNGDQKFEAIYNLIPELINQLPYDELQIKNTVWDDAVDIDTSDIWKVIESHTKSHIAASQKKASFDFAKTIWNDVKKLKPGEKKTFPIADADPEDIQVFTAMLEARKYTTYVSSGQLTIQKKASLDKTGALTEEETKEVAAKYGAEYITAYNHFYEAFKNQHLYSKAFKYALNEMSKVGINIKASTLTSIIETYLKK